MERSDTQDILLLHQGYLLLKRIILLDKSNSKNILLLDKTNNIFRAIKQQKLFLDQINNNSGTNKLQEYFIDGPQGYFMVVHTILLEQANYKDNLLLDQTNNIIESSKQQRNAIFAIRKLYV